MFCSNCGQQIPDNSRFCENCGSRVEIEKPPRREPQRSAHQNHVEEGTFTESPKQSKKLGFVPMVLIFAVITVGVWFLKGFLGDGEPVVYAPNQGDTGEYDVSGIKGIEDIGEDDASYIIERLSTYDRPTLEEFAWYDEVFNNGVWPDATPVTELPYMLGGWKCYIVYDPYVNTGSEVQELANVELSIGSGGASASVDWYQILWNGEPPYDESGEGDSEFVGSYEDGVFKLTGPANLSIGPFYEYQGKYYGFGSLLTPDGTTADFWLMR